MGSSNNTVAVGVFDVPAAIMNKCDDLKLLSAMPLCLDKLDEDANNSFKDVVSPDNSFTRIPVICSIPLPAILTWSERFSWRPRGSSHVVLFQSLNRTHVRATTTNDGQRYNTHA